MESEIKPNFLRNQLTEIFFHVNNLILRFEENRPKAKVVVEESASEDEEEENREEEEEEEVREEVFPSSTEDNNNDNNQNKNSGVGVGSGGVGGVNGSNCASDGVGGGEVSGDIDGGGDGGGDFVTDDNSVNTNGNGDIRGTIISPPITSLSDGGSINPPPKVRVTNGSEIVTSLLGKHGNLNSKDSPIPNKLVKKRDKFI